MKEKQSIFARRWALPVFALISCILWGSATPSIKIGYSLFGIGSADTMSQILFAGMRFTLAGCMVILSGSIMAGKLLKPKKSSLKMILTLAVFQTILQYIFFYVGLSHTVGVKAAVYSGMSSFFALLVSALVFRMEKLSLPKVLGCCIGFVGLLLVSFSPDTFSLSFALNGELLLLLSSVSSAFSSVLVKRFSARENPVALCGYQFFIGGLFLIFIGLAGGGTITQPDFSGWILLLYMGFISACAYTLWSLLLKHHEVSHVSTYSLSVPVFGSVLSMILLNEYGAVSIGQLCAALLLISAGITIVNRQKN